MSDGDEPRIGRAGRARRPVGALIWGETKALRELAALQRDPVYRGRGVARGDGRIVVAIPGLFGTDMSMQPLLSWLRRVGYTPVRSTLPVNAGCPNRLRDQVEVALQRQVRRRPGPVALIGHSRGGMLAWALASRLQHDASHLVLLGSPAPVTVAMIRQGLTGPPPAGIAPPAVVAAGRRSLRLLDPDCTVPECGCPYVEDLRRELHPTTRVRSILSRDDRVVSPDACRLGDGRDVEVGGTHGGLAHNRAVYPLLAEFLSS